jgi:hypothetical protein
LSISKLYRRLGAYNKGFQFKTFLSKEAFLSDDHKVSDNKTEWSFRRGIRVDTIQRNYFLFFLNV